MVLPHIGSPEFVWEFANISVSWVPAEKSGKIDLEWGRNSF